TPARRLRIGAFRSTAIVPVLAVLLAFAVGSVLILISSLATAGHIDPTLPLRAYGAMLEGAGISADPDAIFNGLINTIQKAAPLVLGGLSVGIAFKAGLFNIGGFGQFIMGALGAAVTGAAVAAWPAPAAIAAALAVGSLAGAAWGFIPGALKALTGAHEVVTTIMLNTIATSVIGWLVTGPFLASGFSFSRTGDIGNAAIPIILGRNLDAGVILSILAVPAILFLLWRSTLGFQIRAVGANPSAARYAGMRPTLIIMFTMSLAGFLFGVAGSVEVLGNTHFINASYGTTYGFDAITVALLGRTHPIGIVLAALLFGAMRAGSGLMQITTGIPVEMVDVLQAIVLLFIAADVIVRNVYRIRAAGGGLAELETVTKSYSSGAVR
ncbi:MAG TPA: ABC transporter permease, partial [Candidatus Limnocylindrales bacterium]|nr:ABC transporter permease [Candidatus Limnocylindrales bacterium]